jgi:hypothetical protein
MIIANRGFQHIARILTKSPFPLTIKFWPLFYEYEIEFLTNLYSSFPYLYPTLKAIGFKGLFF